MELHADHGVSAEAALLDLVLEAGLLAQRGAWVSYGTVRLGQGRQAARRHLRDHPELARQELHARLLTATSRAVQAAAS